ncbi:hypothetical protein L9F63_003561, partial [Diploptera punctata]
MYEQNFVSSMHGYVVTVYYFIPSDGVEVNLEERRPLDYHGSMNPMRLNGHFEIENKKACKFIIELGNIITLIEIINYTFPTFLILTTISLQFFSELISGL